MSSISFSSLEMEKSSSGWITLPVKCWKVSMSAFDLLELHRGEKAADQRSVYSVKLSVVRPNHRTIASIPSNSRRPTCFVRLRVDALTPT
jgi:hypothetical protein